MVLFHETFLAYLVALCVMLSAKRQNFYAYLKHFISVAPSPDCCHVMQFGVSAAYRTFLVHQA